jgi:alpha-tubulin suppressor-like RCC1 family protein
VLVSVISDAVSVSVGDVHSCAVLSSGSVMCWGAGNSGRLGQGTSANSNVPVAAVGISNATQVSTGSANSCALHSDGKISCWGNNLYQQLGNSIATESLSPVSADAFPAGAIGISLGQYYACALYSDTVRCVGRGDYGHLGNGTSQQSAIALPIKAPLDPKSLEAGHLHACVMDKNNMPWCWGAGTQGRYGLSMNLFGLAMAPQ